MTQLFLNGGLKMYRIERKDRMQFNIAFGLVPGQVPIPVSFGLIHLFSNVECRYRQVLLD
jgi:hypothetical protein